MGFTQPFIIAKIIIVAVSFILILAKPVWIPYLLAINVLVASVESLYQKQSLTGVLGLGLVIWSLLLKYDDVRELYVIPYLVIYLIWNSIFFYQGFPSWYAAIPQVLFPVVVAMWVFYYSKRREQTLFYFSILRVTVLLVALVYTMSPGRYCVEKGAETV